jgi:hypothetical protein
MNYVCDITFGLSTALSMAAIGILVASVKLKGKGWLLAFLILSLLSSAGFYIPYLLHRNEMITTEAYRTFTESAGAAFQALRICAWALLLGFVLSLKLIQTSAMRTANAAIDPSDHPPPPPPDSPYKGYGGWLSFFGVVQLFVAPVLTLVVLGLGAAAISETSRRYPGFIGIYFFGALGSIAIVGFGIYAAVELRGIRSGAVRTAKRYLLAALGWSVLSFVLPYVADIPDSAREAMFFENIKGFLKTVIPFAIWFSYFSVSKRVKATYVD